MLEFLKQKYVVVKKKKKIVGSGIHKTRNRSLYLPLGGSVACLGQVNFPVRCYSF